MSNLYFSHSDAVRSYQGLSERDKRPYEPLDQVSVKKQPVQSKENANSEVKYEDVEDKKDTNTENTESKYEDIGDNGVRDSKYDSGGYLVATPSMIKRAEEGKIKLRKLKEMGEKIDEAKDDDDDDDNDNDNDNNSITEYADVENNHLSKIDDNDKKTEVEGTLDKPYLRLLDTRPSTRESKL